MIAISQEKKMKNNTQKKVQESSKKKKKLYKENFTKQFIIIFFAHCSVRVFEY